MSITLGNLDLGTVAEVVPVFVHRYSSIEIPLARGISKQVLGGGETKIELTAAFDILYSPSMYSALGQIDRYRLIGESLKLTSPSITTIVYIESINPQYSPGYIIYRLSLCETRFHQLDSCDDDGNWAVDAGGGALTEITSAPTPLEGTKALKLAVVNLAGGNDSRLILDPADILDAGDEEWIAFWLYTDNITDLDDCNIILYHDAGNYALYDFKALVTSANGWHRICIRKSDFTETGTMEWDDIDYLTIAMSHSSQQTFYFVVDDLGAYE